MKMTIKFLILVTTLIFILVMIFKMVSYNMKFSNNKNSTFECGFDLLSKLRLPFSLHFYIISIIFLIFDIELILLLPFVFVMKTTKMKTTYAMMISFFIVLILGFVYEWWMGLLNWLV